jgi:Flp pilus assembly protein TadB
VILVVGSGAAVGLGLFLLVVALRPARPGLAAQLARIEAARHDRPAAEAATGAGLGARVQASLGVQLADVYAARGWRLRSIRADLAMVGRPWESFLATKVLLAVGAMLFVPLLFGMLWVFGLSPSPTVPLWIALIVGAVVFFLPDVQVRQEAAVRRRDFRHVVGAYLDLVSMNLAGGRGVPEALMAAAEVGHGWALWRIRDCLVNARITGISQWEALGRLGDELAVDELRDLSAALGLVADDGAKIRASLTARAATMRHRELAEIEGKAGEQSQSMLVAQLLLCAGFLVFLTYPAAIRIFTS